MLSGQEAVVFAVTTFADAGTRHFGLETLAVFFHAA